MEWIEAHDIKKTLEHILPHVSMPYIDMLRLRFFRSYGSTSRARARIWSFPKIWQQALNLPPHYVIEVISEKFDHLSDDDKARVLIHELLHIPKNFSGSLRPHKMHKWRLNDRLVETYFKEYKSNYQQPTDNRQQPTDNSQQTTANRQQPTANSQQSTANSQQPTDNSQ